MVLNHYLKILELLKNITILNQEVLSLKFKNETFTSLKLQDNSYDFHYLPVVEENFFESSYLKKILEKICYENPQNYESFLAQKGVGPKTVRALSLVSEVIYGANLLMKIQQDILLLLGEKTLFLIQLIGQLMMKV